jgi:hypothetical protein
MRKNTAQTFLLAFSMAAFAFVVPNISLAHNGVVHGELEVGDVLHADVRASIGVIIDDHAEKSTESHDENMGEDTSDDHEPQPTYTVTHADLKAEDMDHGIPVAGSVRNKEGLQSYLKLMAAADDHITSISTDETKTETTISQSGKIFGFIPVTMYIRTTVNADGTARVHYPWYRFLARIDHKVTAESVLEGGVDIKGEKMTTTDQATAVYATWKAFLQ